MHFNIGQRHGGIFPGQVSEKEWVPPIIPPHTPGLQWTLASSTDISTVPELQLDRAGRRAKYRGENQDVEVSVIPVSDLEKDGILNRAASVLGEEGKRVISSGTSNGSFRIETNTSRMTTRTQDRLYVRVKGDIHTRVWWIKDWLFVFRTTGPEDPDAFAEAYLEAMRPAELEKR